MAKPNKGGPPPTRGFWILMACCAIGAIAMVGLLIGGEIQGPQVGHIEHKSK